MRKKLYISIFILIVLVVAIIAAVFAFQPAPAETIQAKSGLKAGDTFTYSMTGISELGDPNATTPPNFYDVNMTDYYKVTITAVEDPKVSFDTQWRFKNGTQLDYPGYVNIETGDNDDIFWAIYAANLTVGKPARPAAPNKCTVNMTDYVDYKDGNRTTNKLQIQGQFYDPTDPTFTKSYLDYTNVHFDRETGMLVELRNRKIYTDPAIILTVEWKLVDSNVWAIS